MAKLSAPLRTWFYGLHGFLTTLSILISLGRFRLFFLFFENKYKWRKKWDYMVVHWFDLISWFLCSVIKLGVKCTSVDAIEYYTHQVDQLKEDFESESQREPRSTGIAFVTVSDGDKIIVTNVENELLASGKTTNSMIVDNFSSTPIKRPIKSGPDFNPRWWSVSHAPYPRYIIWSNLSRKGFYWYLYWLIINAILLLITIFLTTPTFIVQTLENLNITNPLEELVEAKSPLIASYIPTLMLWTFSALVPVLVWYAGYMEKHWTFRSADWLKL